MATRTKAVPKKASDSVSMPVIQRTKTLIWYEIAADLHATYYLPGNANWWHHGDTVSDQVRKNAEYELSFKDDMLSNLLRFVPGVEQWDDYGGLSVQLHQEDAKTEGWSLTKVREYMQYLVYHMQSKKSFRAEGRPYEYTSKDSYGNPVPLWAFPDFVVPTFPCITSSAKPFRTEKIPMYPRHT